MFSCWYIRIGAITGVSIYGSYTYTVTVLFYSCYFSDLFYLRWIRRVNNGIQNYSIVFFFKIIIRGMATKATNTTYFRRARYLRVLQYSYITIEHCRFLGANRYLCARKCQNRFLSKNLLFSLVVAMPFCLEVLTGLLGFVFHSELFQIGLFLGDCNFSEKSYQKLFHVILLNRLSISLFVR